MSTSNFNYNIYDMAHFFRTAATFAATAVIAFTIISCSRMPAYERAPLNNAGDVAINIKTLKGKVPVFYTYDFDGRRIDFFLIKVNGNVQSYFDACAMCYHKKLGYRVEGNEIVCRACNLRYTADELKTGLGSCHPIPLPGRTENGTYIITKEAIKTGLKYF